MTWTPASCTVCPVDLALGVGSGDESAKEGRLATLPENRVQLRFKMITAATVGNGIGLYGLTDGGEIYLYRGAEKGWQAIPMWSDWQGFTDSGTPPPDA